jgi:hypothetical protein
MHFLADGDARRREGAILNFLGFCLLPYGRIPEKRFWARKMILSSTKKPFFTVKNVFLGVPVRM